MFLYGTEELDGSTLFEAEQGVTKGDFLAISSDRFRTDVEGEEIDFAKVTSCEKSNYPNTIHTRLFGTGNKDLQVTTLRKQKFVIAHAEKALPTQFVTEEGLTIAISATDNRLSKQQTIYVNHDFYRVVSLKKPTDSDETTQVDFIVTLIKIPVIRATSLIADSKTGNLYKTYDEYLHAK